MSSYSARNFDRYQPSLFIADIHPGYSHSDIWDRVVYRNLGYIDKITLLPIKRNKHGFELRNAIVHFHHWGNQANNLFNERRDLFEGKSIKVFYTERSYWKAVEFNPSRYSNRGVHSPTRLPKGVSLENVVETTAPKGRPFLLQAQKPEYRPRQQIEHVHSNHMSSNGQYDEDNLVIVTSHDEFIRVATSVGASVSTPEPPGDYVLDNPDTSPPEEQPVTFNYGNIQHPKRNTKRRPTVGLPPLLLSGKTKRNTVVIPPLLLPIVHPIHSSWDLESGGHKHRDAFSGASVSTPKSDLVRQILLLPEIKATTTASVEKDDEYWARPRNISLRIRKDEEMETRWMESDIEQSDNV